MANRIKIEILNNPSDNSFFSFEAQGLAVSFYMQIIRHFIPYGFSPSSNYQVVKGVSASDTLQNLYQNLITSNVLSQITFSLNYPFIYIDFVSDNSFILTDLSNVGDFFEVSLEEITTVEPVDVMPALNLKDISIEVIDTYENDRSLIVEFAEKSSCVFTIDGGDDLIKSIKSTKLDFNMLVANFEDAHFLHLFSGDENRYKVKLNAIDEEENVQLLWQGFLLPDQYAEDYKTAALFVDFTASDMLSALKGKQLPVWYYQNRFPIGELLALLLAKTGLSQPILVNPCVVPANPIYTFRTINIDLKMFIDGEKYKDCYTILDDVITSLGLTLVNYRGYWICEPLHRKAEKTASYFQFDSDGILTTNLTINKEVKEFFSQKESANLTALTPFRKVNVNFTSDNSKNLFSENVVKFPKEDLYNTYYSTGNYYGQTFTQPEVYTTAKINDWLANFNSDFQYVRNNNSQLMWRVATYSGSTYSDYQNSFNFYAYSEAMALSNYLQFPETPYVKTGVLYELELEFEIKGMKIYDASGTRNIEEKINKGDYDKLIPFQLLVNGIEKYSNRPAFGTTEYRYKVASSITGYGENNVDLIFNIKKEIRFDVDGPLTFRILMPIFKNGAGVAADVTDDNTSISQNCFFYANVLKLTALDGFEQNDDLICRRPINFTQENDYPLSITATPDNGVLNSFGLGLPINNNYFKTLDRTNTPYDITNYHYFAPATDLELISATWKSDYPTGLKLFADGKRKACFLERVDNTQESFTDLWLRSYYPLNVRLGYLKSFEGYPNIPKDYQAHSDVVSGDILKYMDVEYAEEDFANRETWKLTNTTLTGTFPRMIAQAVHGIQPYQIYRLEYSALELIFPLDLVIFFYDNKDRTFVPTRMVLDLFAGKTKVTATEGVFEELTDIVYE